MAGGHPPNGRGPQPRDAGFLSSASSPYPATTSGDIGHETRLAPVVVGGTCEKESLNECEENHGRISGQRRAGLHRLRTGGGGRDRRTSLARRRRDSVAARSRRWGRRGRLGPWRRS